MTRGQRVRAGSVGVVTPESRRWWQDASEKMHPGVNVAKGQLRANVCWVHKQPWCCQSSTPQTNYQPGWRCCCESLLREVREALMASILLPVDMPYSVWSARVFFLFFFFSKTVPDLSIAVWNAIEHGSGSCRALTPCLLTVHCASPFTEEKT